MNNLGYSLFDGDGDMLKEYPELAQYPEFSELKERELRFCWLVACKTSPIINKDKSSRVKAALDMTYGTLGNDRPEVKSIKAGKIPEKWMKAIARMTTFSPSLRLRAKFMDEYIFDKLTSLIVLDEVTEAKIKSDADERKKYADLAIKISSEMPSLIQRMEGGYGIKIKESESNKERKVLVSLKDVKDRIEDSE
jgi:hypothetical protein